ncbi:hypothetical protein [Bradyrhizobium sp. DASA03007]|uniref:hypothetical protein n=1 Tax=unclassified Bradyrhizobium TaxID=2631580 RepID=UPI003F7279CB
MARRFQQIYQVKPRDNLGDPEYWNRRFDDIDRRVSSNEDELDSIGGLSTYIEGLALDRLNLVLAPALDKVALVSRQGFLVVHPNTSITLDTTTSQTFVVSDTAERELFEPSPFLTVCRVGSQNDYAFAKLISYSKDTGELVIQPVEIHGNPGPFTDWVIYVGTAISQAVVDILAQVQSARTDAIAARDAAAASAVQTASDAAAAHADRLAADASASAAATMVANVTAGSSPGVNDTLVNTLNTAIGLAIALG